MVVTEGGHLFLGGNRGGLGREYPFALSVSVPRILSHPRGRRAILSGFLALPSPADTPAAPLPYPVMLPIGARGVVAWKFCGFQVPRNARINGCRISRRREHSMKCPHCLVGFHSKPEPKLIAADKSGFGEWGSTG